MPGQTYAELLAQYRRLTTAAEKRRFREQHPQFAARLQSSGEGNGVVQGNAGGTVQHSGLGYSSNPWGDIRSNQGNPNYQPPPTGYPGSRDNPSYGPSPGDDGSEGRDDDKSDKDKDKDSPTTPTTSPTPGLLGEIQSVLDQFGLATPGLLKLAQDAVAKGWTMTEFMIHLRESPDYLAHPLFAANIERTKAGGRFMSEGEVLAWGDEARRLAKQYGFEAPSDNYLAQGLLSGLSLAEVEHRIQIERNINEFGGGVRWVAENLMGTSLTDQDLFEIFDPEHDTEDFDRAYEDALYRGRPVALGLGVRSQAEADAFRMLGVDPTEAYKRWEGVAANAPFFSKLDSIEDLITAGLPADFNPDLSTAENSALVRAAVFHDPGSQQIVNDAIAREIARFKSGSGPRATQGQLTGLLSQQEMASYG